MRVSSLFLRGLLLLHLLALLAWVPSGKPKRPTQWAVSGSSSLQVNGSTNLSKFACGISSYDRLDTLGLTRNGSAMALTGSLQLNLQHFDCHNPVMTRDLRKTLKAGQYPMLCITFLSLNKLPTLSQKPAHITGLVDIDLAGTRKRVEVRYQIWVDAQNEIHLVGLREVTFSDFNLTPPSKFKGMVQTHQKLMISFRLQLKEVV
ncbi:YceI family protein [Rufibacter hautae]|uniref:YceI family protein n=1 Tax=Rufibacter hautae TaxID=2595005 RepID=A0A5B6T741_9BACT|nr:YceI family protein [Rufibacter hautae]KAA3435936.1 YceI family protein [Rufibacter hautae]